MVVEDYDSEQLIYFSEVNTGTNLSTVPNRQEAINNIQKLILEGFDNIPEEYTIEKFDGDGEYIGDKGSGYWITKEVLTRGGQIEKLGLYIDSHGNVARDKTFYLRGLVLKNLLELNGYT